MRKAELATTVLGRRSVCTPATTELLLRENSMKDKARRSVI